MQSSIRSDKAAIGLSLACIVHCLALPLLAFAIPVAGTIAEIEAVHWVLGVTAILISLSVPVRHPDARVARFLVPALLGCGFIASAFFADSLGADETWVTVIGACLMAFAHLGRLSQRSAVAA